MKAAKLRLSGAKNFVLLKRESGSHDFTLNEARQCLGQLMEMALHGEPVCIVHGRHRIILQVEEAAAKHAPVHSAGYFAGCYTAEEIGVGGPPSDPAAPFRSGCFGVTQTKRICF